MNENATHPILRAIRKSAAALEVRHAADPELLARYSAKRDESAFEALVHRHGAMVWHVCLKLLRDAHAAEDAFQATFLVLARSAGSISSPERLGNWLYGVAARVARRSRQSMARRGAFERQHAEELATSPQRPTFDAAPLLELLEQLPSKYRAPMILCYLEGRTNEQAAQQLQWPVGTVKVRLLRGREMLRKRLIRRGLVSADDALAALPVAFLGQAPDALVRAASSCATANGAGLLSGQAIALANAFMTGAWRTKVVTVTGGAILLAVIGVSTGPLVKRAIVPDQKVVKIAKPRTPLAGAVSKETQMKEELEKLQGTWDVVSLEVEGAAMPPASFKGAKIIVKGESFTTISMGATYEGTLSIDVSTTPRRIDMRFTKGPEQGNVSLGIYELSGDSWKLCLTVSGHERPTAFATKAGSGHALETLKRQPGTKP